MSVTDVQKDFTTLTLALTAEFDAPVARVWQMWADPRLLERWWGPPAYPATFVDHDLSVGATCNYYMTGPEGERYHGWWRVLAVDPPTRLEVEDGFADGDGNPNLEMPVMRMVVELGALPGDRTRMTARSQYASLEAMEQVIAMGVEEGMVAAVNQIDALLATG
jgi:uncharacterized protein YndB with AHSA1/START domain